MFTDTYRSLFGKSWDMWIGSILLSILSIVLFVFESPLGSIGGLNNIGQNLLSLFGLAFDESAPNGIPHPADHLYAMLGLSVIIGAMGGSMLAREFAIRWAPRPEMMKGLVGGILMGIGGSIGMGCTISGFYSSLPALSAGGLFFGSGLFIGVYLALRYFIWESEHFPSMTTGKWTSYFSAKRSGSSLQPLSGVIVLILGALLIIPFDPSDEKDVIGFILIGLVVGVVLQRSRFCIFRAIREPFLTGDPLPAQAVIAGLLVAVIGFTAIKVTGAGSEESFIFPNFWLPGLIGGTIFGIGMTSAGACSISSTWRAGEGSVKHWLALVGIIIAMPLTGEYVKPGFLDLLPNVTHRSEFLPHTLGYGGSIFLLLLVLFFWFVVITWNERSGMMLMVGRPEKRTEKRSEKRPEKRSEKMPEKRPEKRSEKRIILPYRKDALLATLIALFLLSGTLFFTLEHQFRDEEEDNLLASDIAMTRIESLLVAGKQTTITAEELFSTLNDGYFGNDPMIISVRSISLYEKGHIPGAVHIPYQDIFKPDVISSFPTSRQIVVYCDNGHRSAEVAALLYIYGFGALSLEWGMASWTSNTSIASDYFRPADDVDHPVTSGPEPGVFTGETWLLRDIRQCGFEETEFKAGQDKNDDEYEILREAFEGYLHLERNVAITSDELFGLLNDSYPLNDPFVLSLRSPPRYSKGHIPGAVNMDLDTMFLEHTLDQLPHDGESIVLVADSVHFGSLAATYLNVVGFNARALKFGMASWTDDKEISPVQYDRTSDCNNYPISPGNESGSLETSTVMGKTRVEIIREASVSYGGQEVTSTNATELFTLLNDTIPENDPTIISVQPSDQYAAGHIPGSINIQPTELFSREFQTGLAQENRRIVIIDSNGQEAGRIAAHLHLLGFRATYIQHGMCGWNTNTSVAPQPLNITGQDGFPMVNGSDPGSLMNATPHSLTLGTHPFEDGASWSQPAIHSYEWDLLRQAIHDQTMNDDPYARPGHTTSQALYYDLIDDFQDNDPYLVSIQSPEDYINAHIPGTQNIALSTLLAPDTLSSVPHGRPVLVISSNGERASVAASLLMLNGIDSLFLLHGMDSWNYTVSRAPNPCVEPAARINDYPLDT